MNSPEKPSLAFTQSLALEPRSKTVRASFDGIQRVIALF